MGSPTSKKARNQRPDTFNFLKHDASDETARHNQPLPQSLRKKKHLSKSKRGAK